MRICLFTAIPPSPCFLRKLLLAGLLIVIGVMYCTGGMARQKTTPKTMTAHPVPGITYKIISGVNGSYGYDIYREGRLLVHQPSMPALPGSRGFATKTGAERVARLVVRKVQQGQMPPTVSIAEMKQLKVL